MDRLELAETAAYRDLFAAAPAALAREHGIRHADLGGGVCCAVDALPGARLLNRAIGIAAGADLAELDRFFGGTRYTVGAVEPDLVEQLAARGFARDYSWMKFRRGVEPVEARTELRVERVGAEHGAAFGRIEGAAYGMPAFVSSWLAELPGRPGWSVHLAFDGDESVGAGALWVEGDQGWLSLGATLPGARGRGAQSAILAARIAEAAERGCVELVTETGEATDAGPGNSYRNLLRAGFEEAGVRENWTSPKA
jgi:GNAT superfamily N-acetyltransferase